LTIPVFDFYRKQIISAQTMSRRTALKGALTASCAIAISHGGLAMGVGNDRTEWYRHAKFGMFILWHIHSLGPLLPGQRRIHNPKGDQRFRLRDLLSYSLWTARAHLVKEAFQQLWDYNSPTLAGMFLDEWCRQTMRSRLEPMKKTARSLRVHRELILNHFRAQKLLSSGVVEGLKKQSQTNHEKGLRLLDVPSPRTRALSLTCQTA
jgi:hypothetical protein